MRFRKGQIERGDRLPVVGDLANAPLSGDGNRGDFHSLPNLNQFFRIASNYRSFAEPLQAQRSSCKNQALRGRTVVLAIIGPNIGPPNKEYALPKIVAGEIEGSLRQRIAAGEWAANGRLPAERELAAEYGVARNTVRSAVEAIANDGTIERHVGRGTFVNGGVAELADIVQRVTGVSPADLMAARLIVEPQAAAIAAKNASSSGLPGNRGSASTRHRRASNRRVRALGHAISSTDICCHA